jgi:beta-galactosidase
VHDPYLYRVKVVVRDGKRVVDEIEQPLGLRTFRVDAQQGFILNDRPYRVHGVSRHHDGGPARHGPPDRRR